MYSFNCNLNSCNQCISEEKARTGVRMPVGEKNPRGWDSGRASGMLTERSGDGSGRSSCGTSISSTSGRAPARCNPNRYRPEMMRDCFNVDLRWFVARSESEEPSKRLSSNFPLIRSPHFSPSTSTTQSLVLPRRSITVVDLRCPRTLYLRQINSI